MHIEQFNSGRQIQGRIQKPDERVQTSYMNGHANAASTTNKANKFARLENGAPKAVEAAKSKPTPSPMSEKRKELLRSRADLPIWPLASDIRLGLHGSKDVMLLVGETGSGKSTQVPQLLLGESWCTGCIAVTQPRRVAAISLARRVAEEMGTLLGSSSPASKVGYSVRFDNNTSPSTKIKFLTEGMLLQEMLKDPWLKEYSAVIVDEVHERGVNVDLILGFLRKIVTGDKSGRKGHPLKTIVMSATADTEALFNFFEEGFENKHGVSTVNGTRSALSDDDTRSYSSWSGLSSSDDESAPAAIVNGKISHDHIQGDEPGKTIFRVNGTGMNGANQHVPKARKVEVFSDRITTCYIEGRQHPVEIMYTPEPVQDFPEAALKTIFQIHYKEPLPGDILVFLTGQDTVESLESLVNEYAIAMSPEVPKMLVLPLFAALPRAAQQAVFDRAPPKIRKVILSTNIAETSVTIPGVRHVIDCGLSKIKEFRPQLGLESLLVKPISKSAAIQRKGRAGREAPGKCYRLYTEQDYLKLDVANTPEILRCDLAAAVLTMKARGIDDVLGFPFLKPPKVEALRRALLQLNRLGALDSEGNISKDGRAMARLPLPPSLSRVLIAASKPEYDCVLPVIDIIACLSVENLFLNLMTEERKEAAADARRELYRREGDHLTLLATVQAYAAENADRKSWTERYFVSHRALRSVMDVRKQLRAQCIMQKLLPSTHVSPVVNGKMSGAAHSPTTDGEKFSDATTFIQRYDSSRSLAPEDAPKILRAFLTGFAPNTARIMPDGSYRTLEGNQLVAVHPSSVLFGKKVEAIMYNELVYTQKSYARGVSAVQMDWWGDAVGAGGTS